MIVDWEDLAEEIVSKIVDTFTSEIEYTEQQQRAMVLRLLRPVRQELERLQGRNS